MMERPEEIRKSPTHRLIGTLELTSKMPPEQAVADVRGWILEELKSRYPDAYNSWLDNEEAEDEDLYRYIFR